MKAVTPEEKTSSRPADPEQQLRAVEATATSQLPPEVDLKDPELYLNRELSWLQFNRRVLAMAEDRNIPLLERVKFAAIHGSNLDEFFMKRIGGLKQQLAAGVQEATVDGRTPQQQIADCYALIMEHQQLLETLLPELWQELKANGIEIVSYADLSEAEKKSVRTDYYENIFPLVTPQSIDPAHPFPFISNLSLNLLVSLTRTEDQELSLARVKVPISAGAPRFMQLGEGERFILLEEVMANNLDMLFPDMEVRNCELFRVTRNANVSSNQEHADDLLVMIESAMRNRKFAPIVRLQVRPDMEPLKRGRLAAELGLDEDSDVFEVNRMMGLRDLWELARLNHPELKDAPYHPTDHPTLMNNRNIFHTLREVRSVLLQHPYESFTNSVERFLKEAATDPKVRAIKMTLYRTDPNSQVVNYLIRAARNGKQVAVAVELKARFDEEANIRLANQMEEAGIHVTYGIVGLKTHCKLILVVRQDYKGLRRYIHFGTGNYHPVTARLYSDLGMFIYDKDLGQDATELFNYLTTGHTPKRNYKKLLPAPKILKKSLLQKIQREVDNHSDDNPGHIFFKMNALEDVDICRALYAASQAGVKIDLIIRDTCRLRPGIPGLSENIQVISVVGRFLEHTRIYYFRNQGDNEIFIGSADAMWRNLEHRVEILVPVEDEGAKKDIIEMLDIQWSDQVSAWDLQSDGSYIRRKPKSTRSITSQEALIKLADKRLKDSHRLRKRKTKNFGRRNLR